MERSTSRHDPNVNSGNPDANRDFYDRNAQEFFERTKDLDMEQHYQPFHSLLEPGARILDAGCGSGRDLKAFSERGYQVVGLDSSEAMVRLGVRPVFEVADFGDAVPPAVAERNERLRERTENL
jgi:SAM-dependent methyltransferase